MIAGALCVLTISCASLFGDGGPRIYSARRIITMDPAQPEATAVSVSDGRIIAVGSIESLGERYRARGERVPPIDRRFEEKVLLPGFVEPHLHPYIAGILLPMHFVTPHAWRLPGRSVPAVRGRNAYLARLREIEASQESDRWLWTWGYHDGYHGRVRRSELDALSRSRPIVVWHRSFHEIVLNSAALEALEIPEAEARAHEQADWDAGHFYEKGLALVVPALRPHLFNRKRYAAALREAREIIHAGGITTISDGAFGTLDLDLEALALRFSSWNARDTPFRTYLLADGRALGEIHGHAGAQRKIAKLASRNTRRLRYRDDAVKLFADGAFFSLKMQLGPPGYPDGHEGEWLMEPHELLDAARPHWRAGAQIHVHANGDAGIDAALDVLEKLQREHPRDDHRYALHHFGLSRPDQIARIAKLGVSVSANPYYVWALADLYAKDVLGPERAHTMVRMGSLERAGVSLSLHSDFTMAPAEPLRLAWVAANRITAEGQVVAPEERLSLSAALRAITLGAAELLRAEDELGSIEAGKHADFTVLERDPYEVPLAELHQIPIWGTVFQGRPYPLER